MREMTSMSLLITGGFRGQAIQRRHFWLQGSNGRCHGNQFLAKISKYITKWPQPQFMRHIHAEFRFAIGYVLSGN